MYTYVSILRDSLFSKYGPATKTRQGCAARLRNQQTNNTFFRLTLYHGPFSIYMCTYVYTYIYVYIHIQRERERETERYTYTYLHMYICICIYIYI